MKNESSTGQINRVGRKKSSQNGMKVHRDELTRNMLINDVDDTDTTELVVYKDKDGLPVIFDTNTGGKKKPISPDDLSLLWHEILSPLTVIKGYTGTLLELSHNITEKQKKQYLQGIESASNRMLRLLENLRDITRLENPDLLITHDVSVHDIVRRMISEMQSQTKKHIIKMIPTERLPLVKVEPEKIEQVITNLLSNAIKYSPQGGDIGVEIRLVRNESELRKIYGKTPQMNLPCIIVSVIDNGIGIPENDRERIFERFYRVNDKATNNTTGAGLGLYICKIIVEAHGGKIWVKNRYQRGTIFNFSLPLSHNGLN